MSKADYVTNSLSKIKHKKWELYVISRVIHLLDDLEIEFVCQQHILLENGDRRLADIFFPQFNLYLEVNERPHAQKENRDLDEIRRLEILQAIGAKEHKIHTYIQKDEEVSDIKLLELNRKVDRFVNDLRHEKKKHLDTGEFEPWDPENKYDPQRFIDLGYLDVRDNPCFLNQRDALRCFGYTKGHYQRGTWRHPHWIDKQVWFPRFVEHGVWSNVLSGDEATITETLLDTSILDRHKDTDQSLRKYTFAKTRDRLGKTLYRFVGEFAFDRESPSDTELIRTYRRTSHIVQLRPG